MTKRVSSRHLKATWAYTVPEMARALGVHERTVRAMIARGMPALLEKRPTLILGQHAKTFLEEARQSAKRPLAADELYCLSCKAARKPYGMMIDLVLSNHSAPRINGLCERCGATCSRVISQGSVPYLAQVFDVSAAGQEMPKGYTEDQFKTTVRGTET